ncbi:uncharacterized protein TNCV_2574891 [Trichonephila clavipes]|nr:uncharacterized protein TNCV_2574891 [Trichonephila clavipes]
MMYASQIHRILSRDRDASRYFIGVFPSDEIPLPKERAILVANTDTRDQEGSHWLAMYIKDKNTLEFFDSYGFPPEMYGVHISKYAEQFTNVKWNKKSIQSLTSNVCELYCVYFLLKISRVTPHRSLNFSRGVISEPDLLTTPDAEILDGFSDQGVIQVRRITIKKDATVIPTKHMILTFNNPNLPATVKARYLNCKIRPYVPNPLRCFKCQRFGHSQTACRGQLTCSRCATVGHPSTDCTLEPKCVNCSQSHPSDSKLCTKWKTEKDIQVIKTNRNIPYVEARKLITPQLSQSYAQVTILSTTTTTTQTDENITKIVCPPLKLL